MHFFPSQTIGHIDERLLLKPTITFFSILDFSLSQEGGVIFAFPQSPVVKGHKWQKENCAIVFPASAAGFIPLPHFTLVVFPALQLSRRLLLRGKPKSQGQC